MRVQFTIHRIGNPTIAQATEPKIGLLTGVLLTDLESALVRHYHGLRLQRDHDMSTTTLTECQLSVCGHVQQNDTAQVERKTRIVDRRSIPSLTSTRYLVPKREETIFQTPEARLRGKFCKLFGSPFAQKGGPNCQKGPR